MPGATPLATHPCRSLCWWADTGDQHDGLRLFACAGCGSQWVRTQGWAPRQADGTWPDGVREQLVLSTSPDAGAAGSAGSETTSGS